MLRSAWFLNEKYFYHICISKPASYTPFLRILRLATFPYTESYNSVFHNPIFKLAPGIIYNDNGKKKYDFAI